MLQNLVIVSVIKLNLNIKYFYICICWMPWMLHLRTSLIIAGDWCGIQGDFFPGGWQCKTSDVMLMKIFGLSNKSDRMSTKNIFSWMLFCSYFVFMCICGNIRNIKCTVIGQAIFHFTCNTLVQKEMYCINTYVHILFFYVLLTLLNKYLNFHGLL